MKKAALVKALEMETGYALDLLRGRAIANFELIDDSQCDASWELLKDPDIDPVHRKLLLTFTSMDASDLDILLEDYGDSAFWKVGKA